MNETTNRAEQLYGQGLSLYEICLHTSGSEQVQQQKRCIQLFQDALKVESGVRIVLQRRCQGVGVYPSQTKGCVF